MKIIMLIVMFFLIGAFFIISENNLHINQEKELNEFKALYSSWMSDLLDNFKQVSGYVVKLDWLPE